MSIRRVLSLKRMYRDGFSLSLQSDPVVFERRFCQEVVSLVGLFLSHGRQTGRHGDEVSTRGIHNVMQPLTLVHGDHICLVRPNGLKIELDTPLLVLDLPPCFTTCKFSAL